MAWVLLPLRYTGGSCEHIPQLALAMLQENPDLYKWLTGQLPAPEDLTRNRAFNVSQRSTPRAWVHA